MRKVIPYIMVVSFALFIFACSQQGKDVSKTQGKEAQSMRMVKPASGEPVLQSPWLRTVLPLNAFAYLRIPNPWGLVGVPNGSVFDRVTGSKAYTESILSIKSGMVKTLFPEMGDDLNPLWQLLLAHSRSPLELALLPLATPELPNMPAIQLPNILFSMVMDFKTIDEVNDFLGRIAATGSELKITVPLEPNGHGLVSIAGLSTFLKYDISNGRLVGLAEFKSSSSPANKPEKENVLNSLQKVSDHPMYQVEKELDSGGQGLFLWINPKPILAMQNSPFGGPIAVLSAMGAQDINEIAFGIGSAGGKHRISLVLDMPPTGVRSFIPLVNVSTKLRAAGDIDGVLMFGLPKVEDLKRIETQAAMMVPAESLQEYMDVKKTMQEKIGFGVEDLLNVFGPESMLLFDDAGAYAAVRVKDALAFDQIMQKLESQQNVSFAEKTIGKRTYHHLVMPTLLDDLQDKSNQEPGLMRLMERMLTLPSHVYWVKEGDYVLLAGTPQGLIDRHYIAPGDEVGDWLKKTQKVNATNSLLLASGRKHGLPRLMYDFNLQMLVALGDLVDQPVDLFAFPSALEAGLPEYGGFSFKFDSSEKRVALEFSYDNNPAELFFAGGGMASIAMVGILSAIAIPAYNDYTVRAKMSAGMAAVLPLQESIAGFYNQNARLPTAKEAEEILVSPNSDVIANWEYDEHLGAINIIFSVDQLGEDNVVIFVPRIEEGHISWECSSTMNRKYLPSICN